MRSDVLAIKTAAQLSVLNAYGLQKAADLSLADPLHRALAGYLAGAIPGAVLGGGIGYATADKDGPKLRRTLAGALIGSTITGGLGAAAHGYRQHLVNADALAHMAGSAVNPEDLAILRRQLEEAMDRQREHAAEAAKAKGTFFERPMSSWAAAAGEKADNIRAAIEALQAQQLLREREAQQMAEVAPTYLEALRPHLGALRPRLEQYLRGPFKG